MPRGKLQTLKEIALGVKEQLEADNVGLFAASVAFFAMFSVFPLLIAAVSAYGMFTSVDQLHGQMTQLTVVLPDSARTLIEAQLQEIVEQRVNSLSWSAFTAIFVALWSASTGASKLIEAVSLAYDDEHRRSFIRKRLLALALTVGLIAAALASFAIVAVLPAAIGLLDLAPNLSALVSRGRWLLLAVFFAGGTTVLYELASGRRLRSWKWGSLGAALATVLWLLASLGFSFYVERFGTFGETYGALGGVVVLMLWFYLSAFAILLGAELNAVLEARAAEGATENE